MEAVGIRVAVYSFDLSDNNILQSPPESIISFGSVPTSASLRPISSAGSLDVNIFLEPF